MDFLWVQTCTVHDCHSQEATENEGMENAGLENVGPNRMGGNRRTGKRRTKIPGVEKARLENAGTSCVWVAKHNIINVHLVRGHV